jgi:hypothetical protein
MSSYILSNANRFYAALETAYGQAAPVTSANRYPAVQLTAKQVLEQIHRRDKTGSRTFLGTPSTARRSTSFQTQTYLTSWNGTGAPSYGPLFQAALGGTPVLSAQLSVSQASSQTTLQTTTPHKLTVGSGVSCNKQIRFVTATPDASTLTLNAPFTSAVMSGSTLLPAITYSLAASLPSLTLYDYWDPSTAVQRIIAGGGVDTFELIVNGDFHEFTFKGPASDVIDSSSFVAGTAGLSQFPAEPALAGFDYSVVPGQLGEAWLGGPTNQFFTLTGAQIQLRNNLETRHREYGATLPRALSPGMRHVLSQITLLAQTNAQTAALYQAARSRTPVAAMLQLGQQQGQLMGVYLPNVQPEIPVYNDSEFRLQWDFQNNLAQGQADDELYIAFA